MSKTKLTYIKWCTGHYKSDFAKKKAKELRESGKYLSVKLGGYVREKDGNYCLIYVAPKDINESGTIKVKSAVKVSGTAATVGITHENETIVFLSKDYDNEGNVSGTVKKLPFGKDSFYMAGYNYRVPNRKRLGYSIEHVHRVQNLINEFIAANK